MRLREKRCGTFSADRRCTRRRCRLPWTGSSTWPSPRDRRFLRLGSPEDGQAPRTFATEIGPKALAGVDAPRRDCQPPPFVKNGATEALTRASTSWNSTLYLE